MAAGSKRFGQTTEEEGMEMLKTHFNQIKRLETH
jgi:hypothetical protein